MTDHANELRRYSRKIGHPAGDVPSVMLAAADEIERLAARLEAAEKERDWHAERCEDAMNECARLRNKVEQMEKQEPARLVTPTAYRWRYRGAVMWQYGELTEETARLAKEHNHEVQPLYALPGAHPKPDCGEAGHDEGRCGNRQCLPGAQPAPSIKDAIIDDLQSQFDSEGITEHDSGDALIRLSDAIAAVEDNFVQSAQSVPDGWKLVPIEPTQEMINRVIDERLDALAAGKDHTFIDIYKAMLAAAPKPEAKP